MERGLRGRSALDHLGTRLDSLLEAVGTPVTARRPWLQTWADAYRDDEPWCVTVDGPGGGLAACALLARRRRAGIVDVTALGRGDYAFFPARDPEAAARLATAVADAVAGIRGPWRLHVEQLPVGDPVAAALASRLPRANLTPGDPSPVVRLDPNLRPEDHLSPRANRSVRRATNRLRREHVQVEVVHESSGRGIGAYLPEMESVWRERDRSVGRSSEVDDLAGFSFFLAVVSRLAEAGQAELTVLLLDGRMAAFALCLVDGPAYRVWVPRISPRFAPYGPGHFVTRALIARALETGRDHLDWMRGEEPYKLQTATHAVEHERLLAWSSPAVRAAVDVARLGRARAARYGFSLRSGEPQPSRDGVGTDAP